MSEQPFAHDDDPKLVEERRYEYHQVFEDDDFNTCVECGAEWAWDGDLEKSRVCMACRLEAAELLRRDDFPFEGEPAS